jgi:VCBS repeat-containing protein
MQKFVDDIYYAPKTLKERGKYNYDLEDLEQAIAEFEIGSTLKQQLSVRRAHDLHM